MLGERRVWTGNTDEWGDRRPRDPGRDRYPETERHRNLKIERQRPRVREKGTGVGGWQGPRQTVIQRHTTETDEVGRG